MGAHEAEISSQGLDVVDLHATADASQNRGAFVAVEVATGSGAQEIEHVAQRRLVGRVVRLRLRPLRWLFRRQLDLRFEAVVRDDPLRHLLHPQHPVDHAGVDGGLGHAAVLRLFRVLGDREPAALLDTLEAEGAVAIGTGEDDGSGMGAMGIGEAAKEEIYCHVAARAGRQFKERKISGDAAQHFAWWDHVNRVGADPGGFADLDDLQRRRGLQQVREDAFVIRRKMEYDDERESRVGGQILEEVAQRFDAAGRTAERNGAHPVRIDDRHRSVSFIFDQRPRCMAEARFVHGVTPRELPVAPHARVARRSYYVLGDGLVGAHGAGGGVGMPRRVQKENGQQSACLRQELTAAQGGSRQSIADERCARNCVIR